MEKTLVLIKPDALGENHAGDILKIYEDAGFKIVAAKILITKSRRFSKRWVTLCELPSTATKKFRASRRPKASCESEAI